MVAAMSTEAEQQTREQDVDAFFALSRPVLYGSAVGLLALDLGAVAAGMALEPVVGVWVVPLYPLLATLTSAGLRTSAAGRGALWTLSRKGPVSSLSPTRTVAMWFFLTALSLAAAAALS